MEKQHLYFVDWMKSLGMWVIVLGHFFPPFLQYFTYSFSVQLFFFISGFLFHYEKSYKQFFLKNGITLFIPYLIWGILVNLPFYLKGQSLTVLCHSLEGILLGFHNFKGAPGCGGLWFIMTLLWVKLLTQTFGKIRYGIFVFLLLCLPMAVVYRNAIYGTAMEYWGMSIGNMFVSFPFFVLGFYMSHYKQQIVSFSEKIKQNRGRMLTVCSLGGVILMFLLAPSNGVVYMIYGGYGNYFSLYLLNGMAGIVVVFLCSLFLEKTRWTRYTRHINVGSIMILATHMFLVSRLNPLLIKTLGDYEIAYELSTVVMSVFILVLFIPAIKLVQSCFSIALGGRNLK